MLSLPKIVVVVAAAAVVALDFEPHPENMTCSGDVHSTPWVEKIIGVNLGGWLVLEPWITPSLFYQFLGADSEGTAMDTHSFCRVLGPVEGNRQLRKHWETWVTETHISKLASLGINSIRIPIGDWMFEPYGPYRGCTDGALEVVDRVLGWAASRGLKVLLDVHAVRRSANGLDNGGIAMGVKWTSTLQDVASDAITFEHWPRRSARWMGSFDGREGTTAVNWTHVEASIRTLEKIASTYAAHPAVVGLEAVNEPWQFTPLWALKKFYWESYLRVKAIAPSWRFVMHDSFRFDTQVWGGFMAGCPDIALDTHIYQAWFEPSTRDNFYSNACAQKNIIQKMEKAFGPVIVGEWSLATDNCAMWLNGFNDNLPGYPKLPCKLVPCPSPYVIAQPGAPPSILKPLQGPFGTGVSGPQYGLCPVDRDWLKRSPGDELGSSRVRVASDLDAQAKTPDDDDTDEVMRNLGAKKLQAFGTVAHGFFFWNFRTELEDQWSYLRAVDRGWLPADIRNLEDIVGTACDREDVHCRAKRSASDADLRDALGWLGVPLADHQDLRAAADEAFDDYWVAHRQDNENMPAARKAACDFGGSAELTETPYKCVARRVEEKATRDGMVYCVNQDPARVEYFYQLSGEGLYREADVVFDEYWEAHRFAGATCDFGGGATLVLMDPTPEEEEEDEEEELDARDHHRSFFFPRLLAPLGIFAAAAAVATITLARARFLPATRVGVITAALPHERAPFVGTGVPVRPQGAAAAAAI
ncbi:hypothetical protein CTAYLR_000038 [Chrysophaeum taylorii]|uniref:X8 domain-containing protein n=1 Tax=Chrysophaeum taylorii TaxID=2483200 RepID=A0AAD7UGU4_9STRA|nr:hypothetical protein CTAYLR_000038 [Chrysophaeum taylorii]